MLRSDPWGQLPYVTFTIFSRYADTSLSRWSTAGAKYDEIVPATQSVLKINLRSAGPDTKAGTGDDFDLATFDRLYANDAGKRQGFREQNAYPDSRTKGAVVGKVTDGTGGVIPGASVRAVAEGEKAVHKVYETVTGKDGSYVLGFLSPGQYEVCVQASGFRMMVVRDVSVSARKATQVNVQLQVGGISHAVTVMAAAAPVQTSTATIAGRPDTAPYTPRLREYFPETLLWQPAVVTGPDGRTEVNFKLVDNITTWKVDVIGSTVRGEIGTASAEIRAFQPFFVDHSPPRVLTQGDEIQLPVTIRNYLEQAQDVAVSMRPENWFRLLNPVEQTVQVAAGASANVVFPLQALAAITDGKQRLTATSPEAGDAIEKPVSVHPDGNEISETVSSVFRGKAILDLTIPPGAIRGSARGELRIYPSLLAHVVDSVEAILQRPYGCAEQTISAAYPNLLFLQILKKTGNSGHPSAATARSNVRLGVDRLLGYQAPEGGFSYWGRGTADPSLTAYAISFLKEAQQSVTFDEQLIENAEEWLMQQQSEDGSWPALDLRKQRDERRTMYQTAFLAMALSGKGAPAQLSKALDYLARQSVRFSDPYMIAAHALAALGQGDAGAAGKELHRLRALARREAGMIYWNLETITPFYGWGLAGRLETTALAVRALAAGGNPADGPLIDGGLLFLLRNKDRYGVWHSTQATIRALEAILAASKATAAQSGPVQVEIGINDRTVNRVSLPPATELSGSLRIDLSEFLSPGRHRVTLRSAVPIDEAHAQLALSYYLPWERSAPAGSKALRLKVRYDKPVARLGDTITCSVDAERVGFRGYGMMVAEIGLPPGADVDRQSLDSAVQSSGWRLSNYDVFPDRIVAYLWPEAGGTSFSFRFRPRFAMGAKSAPSLLYDYYNPEARSTSAPVRFSIKRPE